MPSDCSVELSPLGYQFFTDVFHLHDKVRDASHCLMGLTFVEDKDGALNEVELADVFSTSPGNLWASTGFPDTTVTDDAGHVTLQGWLAQWRQVWSTPPCSHVLTSYEPA